jgi:hypothetical protein
MPRPQNLFQSSEGKSTSSLKDSRLNCLSRLGGITEEEDEEEAPSLRDIYTYLYSHTYPTSSSSSSPSSLDGVSSSVGQG